MEQIVGVDRQSFRYVADNGFKAAVLLSYGNNGIRSRLLEFGLDFLGGADTVCARRERQLDRAVLANLSGCAVDCTGVVRLNRRGVGEFAGAVRAGNLGIVLYKVGEVNADGLVAAQRVRVNRIDQISTVRLYRRFAFRSSEIALGNRPLFNHLAGVRYCSEGDYTAVRLIFAGGNRAAIDSSGQAAVCRSRTEVREVLGGNLEVYRHFNIFCGSDFAFRIGQAVAGGQLAVYLPLLYLIAGFRLCGESDFFVLINGYAFGRHGFGFDLIAVDIIQRIRYRAVAGRSGSLGGVGSALGKFSADGQIVGQFADGVSAVGLCRSLILSSTVYNPVLEMPAAFGACLQLNLAAAGNLGQIVHSFAVYGCNDRAMLHFRCGNRKCGTVGLERNLGILSDGEGIAAVSVELSCFNSLAVHLIGLARGGSIACLGRYRNPGIAGDAVAALERLGKRLGGIVRINRLIACGDFAVQCQRVAVALKYGDQINILHANLDSERVGAVVVLGACRIVVCTEFLADPLLEVPAGIRRCGEVKLCTAGNVSREVGERFIAAIVFAGDRTALIILNGGVQHGIGGFEEYRNRCRFCTCFDGNAVCGDGFAAAVRDRLTAVGPVVNRVACIGHGAQRNIGVGSEAGKYRVICRFAGIETCGNDRRRTDRVPVCAFAEVLSLEGQDVSRAVYRVNTGDKGKFVVVVQRFVGSSSLARRNRVVAGCNVRLERYRIACGVDCGIAKVQSINLISSHVFRVCRERKLILVFRVDLILCNAVLRGDNAQRNGTLNNGKLGFRNRLVFAVDISIQRVSADIQLIVRCQRLRILGTGNRILEGCADLFQIIRTLGHAGERRRYRIAVGEAGDAVVILAVGERQLVAGCIANENHLAFRIAHILEYIAARIIRGNRVGAVCGHDNILCNVAGFVNLSRNCGREVRAANQEAERAGRDGGGSRRGTHFSADVQRAVELGGIAGLNILRRNRQLTLRRAFAVNRVDFGRVSGNAVLGLGGVIVVKHIQTAAVSALVGRTGVFDAQRIGGAAGDIDPGTAVQLLPLIAYALVLTAIRILIVFVILNRCSCQRIRIDRQNRLIFLAVNRYRNIGIACCGLGAAGQRFAVNAVALLLSLVVVAGLNLIFILGIGRQVLIRVAEGVGAVIVTLTIGERHKCEFLAAGAVREVVVAVQLETGNDLVVRPRQGDGIIGGCRNILLKIVR